MITPAALFLAMIAISTAPDSLDIYFREGRYSEADRIAKAMLDAAERAPAPDSLNVAQALEAMMSADIQQSRAGEEEIARARRAVAIRERAQGTSDPRITPALNSLGS
jgi:hypothetical protein